MSKHMEMETENFKFFQHKECEFFPCHEVKDKAKFNCLFCYCPLYVLGENCGGNFRYTENGVKDCTLCGIPHSTGGYDYIMDRFKEVIEMVKKEPEERDEEE
ncbi:MAG: cysteine-rich small domain-containing protein [Firmicutes bacterium]|nr:cysteine-rich small domain-containing protein [Bacillota bacterium]